MEDFENSMEMETEGEIGVQANNCCDDCARLEGRVAVAERDIEWLNANKADTTYVDAKLGLKADKTYVDAMLNLKADQSALNALESDFRSFTNYSYTETVAGRWVDGKPIYRKVVHFGTLPNTGRKTAAHGIQDIGTVIRLSGMAQSTVNTASLPLPYVSMNPNSVNMSINRANISVETISDMTKYINAIVLVEYTKTTD